MPPDIKKLAESLPKKVNDQQTALAAALKAVDALSNLVQLLLLEKQLTDINGKIEGLTGTAPGESEADGPNLSDALSALEDIGTSRIKDGKREYLLHRLTENFEYENAQKSNEYTTKADTQWSVEQGVAQLAQDRSEATLKGANPVVSCWIPEANITNVGGAQANTGQWGNLGENPHKNSYLITVKPGNYEIYQELKE